MKRIKLISRKNLKMTDKKLASQCVHAAIGLYKKNPQNHWSCIVLEASDAKFEEAKLLHGDAFVATDGGYTEVPAGSETCMAFYEEDPRMPDVWMVDHTST